jgi:capsular polysaccharide biosynthesis protein
VTEPLSIGQFGQVATRHWLLIISGLLLGGLAGFGVTQFMTPVYTATATQLVKGLPGTGPAANYEAAQYAVSRAKSYPAFIYSLSVLEGVRSDMGNAEDIIHLRKELSATNPIDTPLVRISATGPTPQLARDKANSAARHMARFITQIETVAGKSPISVDTAVQAGLSEEPTSPKTLLVAALGAMVGLVLAIGSSLIHAHASGRRQGTPPQRAFDRTVDQSSGTEASEPVKSSPVVEKVTRRNTSETLEETEAAAAQVIGDTRDRNEASEVAYKGDFAKGTLVAAESAKGAAETTKITDGIAAALTRETTEAIDFANALEPWGAAEPAAVLEVADTGDASNAGLPEWILPWWIDESKMTEISDSADAMESAKVIESASEATRQRGSPVLPAILRQRHGLHADTEAEGYQSGTESEPNGAEAGQAQAGERTSPGQGRSSGTRVSAAT